MAWETEHIELQVCDCYVLKMCLAGLGSHLGGLKAQVEALGDHLAVSWSDLRAMLDILGAVLVARSGMIDT